MNICGGIARFTRESRRSNHDLNELIWSCKVDGWLWAGGWMGGFGLGSWFQTRAPYVWRLCRCSPFVIWVGAADMCNWMRFLHCILEVGCTAV